MILTDNGKLYTWGRSYFGATGTRPNALINENEIYTDVIPVIDENYKGEKVVDFSMSPFALIFKTGNVSLMKIREMYTSLDLVWLSSPKHSQRRLSTLNQFSQLWTQWESSPNRTKCSISTTSWSRSLIKTQPAKCLWARMNTWKVTSRRLEASTISTTL